MIHILIQITTAHDCFKLDEIHWDGITSILVTLCEIGFLRLLVVIIVTEDKVLT